MRKSIVFLASLLAALACFAGVGCDFSMLGEETSSESSTQSEESSSISGSESASEGDSESGSGDSEGSSDSENPDGTENPGGTENPDGTETPDGTENPDGTEKPGETENPGDGTGDLLQMDVILYVYQDGTDVPFDQTFGPFREGYDNTVGVLREKLAAAYSQYTIDQIVVYRDSSRAEALADSEYLQNSGKYHVTMGASSNSGGDILTPDDVPLDSNEFYIYTLGMEILGKGRWVHSSDPSQIEFAFWKQGVGLGAFELGSVHSYPDDPIGQDAMYVIIESGGNTSCEVLYVGRMTDGTNFYLEQKFDRTQVQGNAYASLEGSYEYQDVDGNSIGAVELYANGTFVLHSPEVEPVLVRIGTFEQTSEGLVLTELGHHVAKVRMEGNILRRLGESSLGQYNLFDDDQVELSFTHEGHFVLMYYENGTTVDGNYYENSDGTIRLERTDGGADMTVCLYEDSSTFEFVGSQEK